MTTTLSIAERSAETADAAEPFPLPVCWAIWVSASVAMWWLFLRLIANFAA